MEMDFDEKYAYKAAAYGSQSQSIFPCSSLNPRYARSRSKLPPHKQHPSNSSISDAEILGILNGRFDYK